MWPSVPTIYEGAVGIIVLVYVIQTRRSLMYISRAIHALDARVHRIEGTLYSTKGPR